MSRWGAHEVQRLAGAALDLAGTAGVEVLVQRQAGGLTRFANSQIHQNVWSEDVEVRVRVVTDDARVGVAAVHTDDPARVAETARRALELARLSPPETDFAGLAPAASVHDPPPADDATGAASPAERAAAVRALLAEVPVGHEAAGAYETRIDEVGVYTTAGQRAYAPVSSAQLSAVVMGPSSSGWAESGGRAMADVDPAAAGRRASAKARTGADPVEVPAGAWPVILEPPATGNLLGFLAYLAFGGKAFLENRSFASHRMGEQVTDPAVTIVDDARSPDTIGLPFDYEGTPKSRVALISEGVLQAVVHDRGTAKQAGTASTGHGLPAPNAFGPLPLNPLLQPGDGGSLDDLVAGTERALLVTRFHYTNVVHPVDTVITGMTRDGTFLVEDGRITKPVRNLRFTQSILGALEQVDAITTDTGYSSGLFDGGSRYPALRLPAFHFTGTTTFG